MSIETKYRPETFEDVVGQDQVVKSLQNAVKKKLGRAYLFTGPSGVGKTTLARITAKYLGCLPEDIQEEDAATKTGIDDMRAIIEGLLYKPMSGGTTAIIIDECHALSKAAVQSLLKALEDPPPWVYWFLCTSEEGKVLKTIKTRCLAYQLKEVSLEDLVFILEQTDEATDVPAEVLDVCAREAGGSPRQALSNLGVCGSAEDRDEAAQLLRSAADVPQAFELARLLMDTRSSWNEVAKLLNGLGEVDPESVRHVVRAYMTKVALNPKNSASVANAMAVLEEFSKPFSSADRLSPLVLACGRIILGDK